MFKFLKDKISKAVESFSKKVEEEGEEIREESFEKPEKKISESPEKKGFLSKLKDRISGKDEEEPKTEIEKPESEKIIQKEKPKADVKESVKPLDIKSEGQKKIPERIEKPARPERPKKVTERPVVPEKEAVAKIAEPERIIPAEHQKKEGHPKSHEIKKESERVIDVSERKISSPPVSDAEPKEPAEEPRKKGFMSFIKEAVTKTKIGREKFDELFWELELAMLENNVAMEVIEKIKEDLAKELVDKPLPRSKVEEAIMDSLRDSIEDLFLVEDIDIMKRIEEKKPYVICFIGVNGSGKTTTIAKFAHMLKENGKSVVLAASDTFRAAAIDQLSIHADRLNVKIIKHDYGSDAAAVAFDAVKHAESKGKDVVLIDTAGRLHSNKNLMDELKKVIRIAKPDLKLFIGESITGNDCIEQAQEFNEAVGIDGIILSKADIDEKGGASISVSYVTKKPILYIGTGQEYKDLEPFEKEKIISALGI